MMQEQKFIQMAAYFTNRAGGTIGRAYLMFLLIAGRIVLSLETTADTCESPGALPSSPPMAEDDQGVLQGAFSSLLFENEHSVSLLHPLTEFDLLLLSADDIKNLNDVVDHFFPVFQGLDAHWNAPLCAS